MSVAESRLTHARLLELLCYDQETGRFTWRIERRAGRGVGTVRRAIGDSAGSLDRTTGYMQLNLSGVGRLLLHRVAWFYVHGAWPVGEIDHLDGARARNAIANLRDVPPGVNRQNRRRARMDSTSGVQGVHFCKKTGKYVARIQHEGRTVPLGYYESAEAAHQTFVSAKRRLHEGCTI